MREYWSMTEGVFNCLIDTKRTGAFKKAIRKTVKKGDVVVDMGTGSGVLAMLAADAGAAKVYAVEFDKKNVATLNDTFALNGYADTIAVVEGDVTKIQLPEKVDVIIGEMIATALIEELQIPAMNNMLKYAKENVRVLLHKYQNFVELVSNNDRFYGKKFKVLRYEYPDEPALSSKILSDRVLYASVDFSVVNKKNKINTTVPITITKTGVINGIRISSDTIFHNGDRFDFSFAYSYPIILPIADTKVKKGEIYEVSISYEMCKGFKNFTYNLEKQT